MVLISSPPGKGGGAKVATSIVGLPQRLRDEFTRELKNSADIDLRDDPKAVEASESAFAIESTVTSLQKRTTPRGELEVSCDINVTISLLPGKRVVGIVSGEMCIRDRPRCELPNHRGPRWRDRFDRAVHQRSQRRGSVVRSTHSSLQRTTAWNHSLRGQERLWPMAQRGAAAAAVDLSSSPRSPVRCLTDVSVPCPAPRSAGGLHTGAPADGLGDGPALSLIHI